MTDLKIIACSATATGYRYVCNASSYVECFDKDETGKALYRTHFSLGPHETLPKIKVTSLARALEILENWLNTEFVVGRFYRLVGGHVLRFHGLWGESVPVGYGYKLTAYKEGQCLAFCQPSVPLGDRATGYAASRSEVMKEVTTSDLEWLFSMPGRMKARNLYDAAAELEIVIKELRS